MSKQRTFSLCLANRQSWQFVSDRYARELHERLAAVMQLDATDPQDVPRLILTFASSAAPEWPACRVPESVSEFMPDLPADGWTAQDVGRVRLLRHQDRDDVICSVTGEAARGRHLQTVWGVLTPILRNVQETGGCVAHASLLVREDQGVLLVAPSGMGKSTCARRIGYPWSALCDDQALVVKVREENYHCHPLPTWSALFDDLAARSWNVQRHVPLKAIFFLERSDMNRVQPLGKGRAVALLSKSAQSMAGTRESGMDRDEEIGFKRMLFDNASDVVKSVPCFVLYANLTTRFWEQMESVL
jgi:SynChlorMet cassette protein ScmC